MSHAAFREKYGPWALVTGASSGIGAEFSRQLAARGLSIVLVARREDRLQALAAALKDTCHVDTLVVTADLTHPDAHNIVSEACKHLQIGLLINNAGIASHGSFFKHPIDSYQNMIALNITAVTAMAHAFGRQMCLRGKGGIIFISSISASGMPWMATYCSTKSYVTCLALTLRDELNRNGVDCMSLEPGLVVSEMTLGENEADEPGDVTLMPTEQCVSEALQVFGRKAVYTPGLRNRIIKNLLLLLPRPLALWLLSKFLLTQMDKQDLRIEQ